MFVCYVFIVLRAAVSAAPVAQISTKDPNFRLANIVCPWYSDVTQLRGLQTALQRQQLKKNRLVTVKTERYAGEYVLPLLGNDCFKKLVGLMHFSGFNDDMLQELAPACSGHNLSCKLCTVKNKPTATTTSSSNSKPDNRGRKFYVCSFPRDQQCKFFLWAEENPHVVRVLIEKEKQKHTDESQLGPAKIQILNRLRFYKEKLDRMTVDELKDECKRVKSKRKFNERFNDDDIESSDVLAPMKLKTSGSRSELIYMLVCEGERVLRLSADAMLDVTAVDVFTTSTTVNNGKVNAAATKATTVEFSDDDNDEGNENHGNSESEDDFKPMKPVTPVKPVASQPVTVVTTAAGTVDPAKLSSFEAFKLQAAAKRLSQSTTPATSSVTMVSNNPSAAIADKASSIAKMPAVAAVTPQSDLVDMSDDEESERDSATGMTVDHLEDTSDDADNDSEPSSDILVDSDEDDVAEDSDEDNDTDTGSDSEDDEDSESQGNDSEYETSTRKR
jgi:hypothetical protein